MSGVFEKPVLFSVAFSLGKDNRYWLFSRALSAPFHSAKTTDIGCFLVLFCPLSLDKDNRYWLVSRALFGHPSRPMRTEIGHVFEKPPLF